MFSCIDSSTTHTNLVPLAHQPVCAAVAAASVSALGTSHLHKHQQRCCQYVAPSGLACTQQRETSEVQCMMGSFEGSKNPNSGFARESGRTGSTPTLGHPRNAVSSANVLLLRTLLLNGGRGDRYRGDMHSCCSRAQKQQQAQP